MTGCEWGCVQRSFIGVQKLFELFLPDEDTNRGAGEVIFLSELVLEISQIGRSDVSRMAHKQGEDGRLRGDLGYKGGLGDLSGLPLANRQRMSGQNLLKELIQMSGGNPF